jgi:hypothetical protein
MAVFAALAERLRRKTDRIDPTRMRRPCDRLGRGAPTPDSASLCPLLQRSENAPLVGQRCAILAPGSADRKHHVTGAPRRTASPLHASLSFRYTQRSLSISKEVQGCGRPSCATRRANQFRRERLARAISGGALRQDRVGPGFLPCAVIRTSWTSRQLSVTRRRTSPCRHRANLDLGSARPTLGRARSVSYSLLNQ